MTTDDNDTSRQDLYERSAGTTTLVSQPTGVADPDTADVNFGGSTQDGSHAFFTTTQKMTADDNDTSRIDLYERSSGATTLVSRPTGVADPDSGDVSFPRISADASHVFFFTTQKLTFDDGDTNRTDVYERSAGITTLVSKPTGVADPDSGDAIPFVRISEDGQRVLFATPQKLTADDGDTNRRDTYERSGGITTLISKPAGVPDPNSADVSLQSVSADGSRVFFTTTQKLTAGDNDSNRIDAYAALPLPATTTLAATGVGARKATLHGAVNPNTKATSYRFEYGKTTAYGSLTPAAGAGSGGTPRPVAQEVTGLEPNTTYHFRLRATNADGTTLGGDRAFKTSAVPPARPRKANLAGVKKTIRVGRNRRFRIRFRATPGLKGTARFRSVKKVRVPRKTFTVPASGKVTLRFRLSRKSFRALKRKRQVKTKLTVTLRNSAGLTSKATKRVTLKAPKRRRS
jgi:hypothetical protein